MGESNKAEESVEAGVADIKYPKQRSKYQLRIRGMRNGRRKKFRNHSPVWLKTRRRIKRKLVG